jgi:hypothetical protein
MERSAESIPAPLSKAKEALKLSSVEAHHHFPVNHRDGRGLEAELQKFLPGLLVSSDIFRLEGNALLRKKLFLCVASPSPGLDVQNDLLRHCLLRVTE